MLKDFFRKPRTYATIPVVASKQTVPEGVMHKCPTCTAVVLAQEYKQNMSVCAACNYHGRLTARERIALTLDEGSFVEIDSALISNDPLRFPNYQQKLAGDQEKTGLRDAIISGTGTINGYQINIGVMDANFRMASMGSVVGEKIFRLITAAIKNRSPVVIFSASGGARMQEGMLALMQMAKTSAALARLHKEGLLFISIFTNPTTGGVAASFSSLGDINLAEPGALIGFAGRRVIMQTVKEQLPESFQTAEFLLAHGQLDRIVPRHELKLVLSRILAFHEATRGTK
ncbi:MAG: acetyl-coenzyme carboxylase carboxyl transferase subunit beta [Bacillota bacterium]|jgi:acetyl-CoA carboxylase carboxyl transferase subunit beta